ncbi:MAG: disulfide bond formation protein B, partial [Brevundimonas sp.]|uniref:disulfide bond formation protein B n=1 Tax=Brevundimonas sp. TaxID=1871086 RepID=UPI0027239A5B
GTPRIAAFLLAVVFATGTITAVFHMGGEMKWWALPATCSGGGDINLESLAALALGTGPVEKVVMCDAVTWRFLGLSMAGWNALISAALAVFSLLAAKRPKDARAPRN